MTGTDRRSFAAVVAAAIAAPRAAGADEAAQDVPPGPDDSPDPSGEVAQATSPERRGNEQIAMLLYPGFTALDLIGPQYMFASLAGAAVHLVARTMDPVTSDTGVGLLPTTTLDACPRDLTLLFVPGGTDGTVAAIEDDATLDFLADRGARAGYVTSVCTGSMLLGAAGLLDGYRATGHWLTRPLLPLVGAVPVDARVVRDRNRITGAGVTAGIDFGLSLVADRRGRAYAERVQLIAEYAPEPPLSAGTPSAAGSRHTAAVERMFRTFKERIGTAAQTARAARG